MPKFALSLLKTFFINIKIHLLTVEKNIPTVNPALVMQQTDAEQSEVGFIHYSDEFRGTL